MATIAVGGTIYSSSINTGSLDKKSSQAYKLRCGMTLNSQSVANNTSTVTFFVQMCSYGSYGFNGFTSPKAYQSYSVNGGSYTSDSYTQVKKVSASETSWKTVHSMTKTITHNTAGKATVRTRCYFDPHIASSNTTYYYVPAKTGYVYTDTVTLPDLHTPPTIGFISATEQNGYLTPASIGFRDNDIVLNQSIKLFRYNIALYDGATVSTVYINGNAFPLQKNTEVESEYYTSVDFSKLGFADTTSLTLTHSITDSMSISASCTSTHTAYPYHLPYFDAGNTIVKRDGQLTGKVKVNIAAKFYNKSIPGTQGNKDPISMMRYRYYKKGTAAPSTWIGMAYTPDANGYININTTLTNNGAVITDVNRDFVYTFDFQLEDQFGEITTLTKEVPRGQYLWAEFQDRVDFQKITQNNQSVVTKPELTQVGDVKITATNVGDAVMATRYGGTWKLIDKEFTPYRSSKNEGFTASSNTTIGSCYFTRGSHSITMEMSFTTKVQINDTNDFHLLTTNLTTLGINSTYMTHSFMLWGDEAQSIAFVTFATDGKVRSYDQIPDSYIAASRYLEGSITLTFSHENMLDSACNKFYWQRIS